MVCDLEKVEEEEVNSHVPQDMDGQVQHPELSTAPDERRIEEPEPEPEPAERNSIQSHTSSDSIEPIPQAPAQRSKSRSSSVRSKPLSIVPRSKRRGLLGKLAVIPEVDRPYDYKRNTKWLITLIVALAAAAAPMGTAIFLRESWTPCHHPLGTIMLLT
jgi:hypothetical protein